MEEVLVVVVEMGDVFFRTIITLRNRLFLWVTTGSASQ